MFVSFFLSVGESAYVSVVLPVCLPVCLSICLSVYQPKFLFFFLNVCISVPACLSVCRFVGPFARLSVGGPVCLSVSFSGNLSACVSVCWSLSIYRNFIFFRCFQILESLCLSIFLSVCLCIGLCRPPSLLSVFSIDSLCRQRHASSSSSS